MTELIDATTAYLLGLTGMLAGTLLVAGARAIDRRSGAGDGPGTGDVRYPLLLVIPGVAALAYAIMAGGLFAFESGAGHAVYPARYVDWLITTAVMVGYLTLLVDASRRLLALAVGTDALVIALGFVGTIAPVPWNYAAFGLAAAALAVLLYLLFGPLTAAAADRDRDTIALFGKLRNLSGVLWMIYPLVWLASPAGVGLLSLPAEALILTILDVTAKVGFVTIVLNATGAFDALYRDEPAVA